LKSVHDQSPEHAISGRPGGKSLGNLTRGVTDSKSRRIEERP
jgi:hypothetical protein